MGLKIICQHLSKEVFEHYGSIISPEEEISNLQNTNTNANQGTAIKLCQVSNIAHTGHQTNATPNINMFRCFTRPHLKIGSGRDTLQGVTHIVNVLEKHPLSSQTFVPMGGLAEEYVYLVVVALPLKDDRGRDMGPDMKTVKAFLCKGNQAVTYGQGVWHAPMIVVGRHEFLDFAVVIYETLDPHKPELDCIEQFYNTPETEITITLI